MLLLWQILGCIAVVLLFLYILFELHYFVRFLTVGVIARFFKRNIHILEETRINGICLTNDIDTLLNHMNNTRYLREVDFARIDFHERSGLFKCILKKGGMAAVGATTIRYRRFIRVFHRYVLTSRIVYWDDQSIYMEHQFITPRDNFVNAVVLTRTRLIRVNADEIMAELIAHPPLAKGPRGDCEQALAPTTAAKPDMPEEVAKWMESNAISSAKIRPPPAPPIAQKSTVLMIPPPLVTNVKNGSAGVITLPSSNC